MDPVKRPPHQVGTAGHSDKVRVIGHQTVGVDRHVEHARRLREKPEIESTDLALIFTNEKAINSLLSGKLTLNADASAAAGSWERKIQAGVPILLGSGIYAWSSSRGLFVGASLDGAANYDGEYKQRKSLW